MSDEAARLAHLGRVLAAPPRVHGPAAPDGVWRTDDGCYRFLATICGPDSKTLETGLGISTALFAGWDCTHTCVVPTRQQADILVAYCTSLGVDPSRVTFQIGTSDSELPRLSATPLDVVLIDGGHAFPHPVLDWHYAGGRLKSGGVLVVDDVTLPALSRMLLPFLDADPRWLCLRATAKWRAYERRSGGSLRDEWGDQAFFGRSGGEQPPVIRGGGVRPGPCDLKDAARTLDVANAIVAAAP